MNSPRSTLTARLLGATAACLLALARLAAADAPDVVDLRRLDTATAGLDDAGFYRTVAGPETFEARLSDSFGLAGPVPYAISGYGIVARLRDTGDRLDARALAALPEDIRREVDRLLLESRLEPADLAKPDTALVKVSAAVPDTAVKDMLLDGLVEPVLDETKSLRHGFLLTALLRGPASKDHNRLPPQVAVAQSPLSPTPPGVPDPQANLPDRTMCAPAGVVYQRDVRPLLVARNVVPLARLIKRTPEDIRKSNRQKRLALLARRAVVNRFGKYAATLNDFGQGSVLELAVPEHWALRRSAFFEAVLSIKPTDLVDGGLRDVEPALKGLASDKPETVRLAAARLLAVGALAAPGLGKLARSKDVDLAVTATGLLGALGQVEAVPIASNLLLEEKLTLAQRVYLVESMAPVGRPAVDFMKRHASDRSGVVRWFALRGLERMKVELTELHQARLQTPNGVVFRLGLLEQHAGASVLAVKVRPPRRIVLFGRKASVLAGADVTQADWRLTGRATGGVRLHELNQRQPASPDVAISQGDLLDTVAGLHRAGVSPVDIAGLIRKLADDNKLTCEVVWIDAED